jgi:hypothetical protein
MVIQTADLTDAPVMRALAQQCAFFSLQPIDLTALFFQRMP